MLTRPITYEDLDGNEVTETFEFHLSKPEIVELEVSVQEGYKEMLERIVKTVDKKALVEQFKKIILMTYGVRSEDRKRFIKNDQLSEEFSQTNAFEALFMELLTSDGAAVEFLTGVLPRDMRKDVTEAAKVTTPPRPPGA